MKPTSGPIDRAASILAAAGFVADGNTKVESVRIPTSRSPVYGRIGGERRTLGGRKRFAVPGTEIRATVGRRTVCIYRRAGRDTEFLGHIPTTDFTVETLRVALAKVEVSHA